MNRKKIIIVSVIFVCLGVAILSRSVDRNKFIYGLSEGTYTVEGAENATVPASITFDLNKDTFSFSYDLLSSYLPHGTWEIEKGKVLATTHDKNYVYISRSMPYWLTRNRITGEIAKPVEPVFADGESRGKAPKWLYRPFQF